MDDPPETGDAELRFLRLENQMAERQSLGYEW